MTLRTDTYDPEQWQLVPRHMTDEMYTEFRDAAWAPRSGWMLALRSGWILALEAAPEPPAQQPTDPTDPGHEVEVLREHVRHLERRVRQLTPAQQPREPDGYAYRYPDPTGIGRKGVIRFGTGGRSVNGTLPIEAVPYWLGSPPPAQQPKLRITLTGAQIRDLADMAGLAPVDLPPESIELETRMTITGPDEIRDEDGNPTRYPLVAYITEYPEEGYIPLSDPLPEAGIGKGESDE